MKMLTQYHLLLILIFLSVSHGFAQDFDWIKSTNGAIFPYSAATTVDNLGNVYITGATQGTIDANYNLGVYLLESEEMRRLTFIIKMGKEGNFIWAKIMSSLPGINADTYPQDVITYGSDLVVVSGAFWGDIDFDPDEDESYVLSNDDQYDGFLWALDGDGNFQWAHQYGDTGFDQIYNLDVDNYGNILATGYFSNTVDFDRGPGEHIITSPSYYDGFILKINTDGEFQWVNVISGTLHNAMENISISPLDEVYVSGRFRGIIDADPGIGEVLFESPVETNSMFIVKLNLAGDFIWAKQIDGLDDVTPENILADSTSVYITSYCRDTLDLDPSEEEYKLFTGSDFNSFIQKLNADGDFLWGKNMGGTAGIRATSLDKDPYGNLFIGGFYQDGYVDLDPTEDSFIVETPELGPGTYDLYLQKFKPDGEFMWAYASESLDREIIRDFKINDVGEIYVVGDVVYSYCDFDVGPGTAFVSLSDKTFLWKMNACSDIYQTLDVEVCDFYTVPSGDETYFESGIYYDTLNLDYGCKNILTINLSFYSDLTALEFDGETFTAYPADAEYKWINCSDSSEIVGESGQTFIPIADGNYAAIITIDGCIDTTDCINSTLSGIIDLTNEADIFIRPNPSNGVFTISVNEPMNIQIYSSLGKLILSTSINSGDYRIDLSGYAQGMYLLSATTQDGAFVINKKMIIN